MPQAVDRYHRLTCLGASGRVCRTTDAPLILRLPSPQDQKLHLKRRRGARDIAAPDGSVPPGTRPSSRETAITSAKIASASRSSTASITADSATRTAGSLLQDQSRPASTAGSSRGRFAAGGQTRDTRHRMLVSVIGLQTPTLRTSSSNMSLLPLLPVGSLGHRDLAAPPQRHPSRADASPRPSGYAETVSTTGTCRMTAVLSPVGKRDALASCDAVPDNSSPQGKGRSRRSRGTGGCNS